QAVAPDTDLDAVAVDDDQSLRLGEERLDGDRLPLAPVRAAERRRRGVEERLQLLRGLRRVLAALDLDPGDDSVLDARPDHFRAAPAAEPARFDRVLPFAQLRDVERGERGQRLELRNPRLELDRM